MPFRYSHYSGDSLEQTWEPLDNISEDLIDDYEAAAAPEKKTYLKEPAEPYPAALRG